MRWANFVMSFIALCIFASLWLGQGQDRPAVLTEHQKQEIVAKAHTDLMMLWITYGIDITAIPPAIEFKPALADNDAAATHCGGLNPHGLIEVNETFAAGYFDAYMRETIPHEVAHLLLCQIGGDGTSHGSDWETVVRVLGAEPIKEHFYLVENQP